MRGGWKGVKKSEEREIMGKGKKKKYYISNANHADRHGRGL